MIVARDTGDGPDEFAQALRAAITERGLSLERIRFHLSQHGYELSVATLSYWQSGRSRPDRATSLAALGSLEDILAVQRGSLAVRLPPRVRRQPGHESASPAVTSLLDQGEVIDKAVAELGLTWQDGFERIAVHDLMQVNEDRTEGRHTIREVFRATRDGADRFAVYYNSDDADAYPYVIATRNCRLGRIREYADYNLVVAELSLSQPLRLGESTLVEYELAAIGQTEPITVWNRGCLHRIREVHIEITFPEALLPRSCRLWVKEGVRDVRTPIEVSGHTLSCLRLDFGPGVLGLSWTW